LKYEWKIILLNKAAGFTYPTYKMKCTVDINLGGLAPTTFDFFGNPVNVIQVVNCATDITPSITASTFTKY
jgi:hypothetical protein